MSFPTVLDADPTAARAALLALAHAQRAMPTAGLAVRDDAALRAALQPFAARVGSAWTDAQRLQWQRVADALVAQALAAQPVVAQRADLALDGRPAAGAAVHDVAALLRDGGVRDEADELDLVVRWWQAARQAGLALDPDFGEVWRDFEWIALWRQLSRLGAMAPVAESEDGDASRLAARIAQVALRYGPLKPLIRLLPPAPGAAPGTGYTF